MTAPPNGRALAQPDPHRTQLDDAFAQLRHRHWTLLLWGPRESPALLAAPHAWQAFTDVLIVHKEQHTTGYRVPTTHDETIFNPEVVCYQYHQSPLRTIYAILSLPSTDHPAAPIALANVRHLRGVEQALQLVEHRWAALRDARGEGCWLSFSLRNFPT